MKCRSVGNKSMGCFEEHICTRQTGNKDEMQPDRQCCAVLLGNYGTKRTDYFCRAAEAAGMPVMIADWRDYLENRNFPDLQAYLQEKENLESQKRIESQKKPDVQNHLKSQRNRKYLESAQEDADRKKRYILKIDPPLWDSYRLEELGVLADHYKQQLEQLACLKDTAKYKMEFFNHPHAIAQLLDKRICKTKLIQAGLPVTEEISAGEVRVEEISAEKACTKEISAGEVRAEEISAGEACMEEISIEKVCAVVIHTDEAHKNGHADDRIRKRCSTLGQTGCGLLTAESLLERMRACRIYQVFVKPVNGSGAAGVSAFRWHPSSGRMALYTCAFVQPGDGLVNTKRLRCFTDPKETLALLDQILKLDCIVERWYAKAEYQGYSYDLRAVMQEGRLDFLLARLSKGPVTNLHLNNRPLETDKLGLSREILERIEQLCKKAMECFPGLRSAGIDILLEKKNKNPRIIEMNAQGDLIYQDIFHENRIYQHQVQMMQNWCMQPCECVPDEI